MDPRLREDDGNAPSFLRHSVIPAEPALDLIGRQESIPGCMTDRRWIPAFARMTEMRRHSCPTPSFLRRQESIPAFARMTGKWRWTLRTKKGRP